MTKIHAISLRNDGNAWRLDAVEHIDVTDIQPNEPRILVPREVDVDWVVEALEGHLDREDAR